jgi:hypothetical protein
MITCTKEVRIIFSTHEFKTYKLYNLYYLYKFDIHAIKTRYEGKTWFIKPYTYEGFHTYAKILL